MERRHPILRRFALLVAIGFGLLLAVGIVRGGLGEGLLGGVTVGVLELRGVIQDAREPIETLEKFRKQDGTLAVVLRIESPGGAVAPSQEIYDAVWRVRERKPVIASLGNVAASGGYYVASAANKIFADPGTITGSIGAIMGVPQYAPLAAKLGVSEEVVKSGRYKDTGHPLRPLAPEERALLQGMVDDVLAQFVTAVAKGRGLEPAKIRPLADGRIFSGAQAHKLGLVDELGGLDAAVRHAWEGAGQTGDPKVSFVRPRRRLWLLELLQGMVGLEPMPWSGGLFYLYRGPFPE